jgi:hypothetical protein
MEGVPINGIHYTIAIFYFHVWQIFIALPDRDPHPKPKNPGPDLDTKQYRLSWLFR